jgi:DNA polymerase III subunit beta
MKIHAEREALVDVAQAVSRFVSQRSPLPVLAGIRITAGDGEVLFDATDLELYLSVRTDFNVEDPGSVVVPGRLFGDILRSLAPGRVTIEDRTAEGRVSVRAGQSEFTVMALPVGEFPAVPDLPDGQLARVGGAELARALRQVVPATSGDEGRPVLTGVLWAVRDQLLRLVATDSYRLALRELAVSQGPAAEAVIPGRALAEFTRHLSGEEEARIWLGTTQGGFEVGRARMITRLIEGKFPDWRQLMPDTYPHRLVADRVQLTEALERMALVAKANTPVKFHLGPEVRLTATQTGVADASETVGAVAYDGEPMTVGFNPRYLIEGLQSLDADKAVLELIDPNRPGRLRADGHEEFTYLLMPVRLWT